MKTTRIICLLLACSILTADAVMAQSKAVEHMSQFSTPFNSLKTDIWQYLKSITQGKSARKVEKTRKKLLEEMEVVTRDVKKVSPFEGDASLKEASLEYLQLSTTVLKEDYAKIVDMEAIAEQSYDQMEAYILAREQANEKLDAAADKLHAAQNVFAEAHNITILEDKDELSKKIEEASAALKYYNRFYLLFFKAYKQEAYAMEALQREDISSFQQNVNSMKAFAEEGLAKLAEEESHKGDASIKVAAKQILDFYKDEAERDFPKVSDFYVKQQAFNDLKAAIEGMRESERTQKDIDKYNKGANEFNEAVNAYNAANKTMNDKRARALDKWNNASAQFLENHSK